jgi:hypothetical protein
MVNSFNRPTPRVLSASYWGEGTPVRVCYNGWGMPVHVPEACRSYLEQVRFYRTRSHLINQSGRLNGLKTNIARVGYCDRFRRRTAPQNLTRQNEFSPKWPDNTTLATARRDLHG